MIKKSKSQNLTQKTLSGLLWKFAERIGAQMVTTIVSIVLARLLLPEDYGLVSIVTILITLCNVFVSSGFGNSLIQKKEADEVDFSSVFYASLVISLGLYAILFFSAPAIARFYENDLLSSVLRVMGLRLPFAAINSVQQAYVSRQMAFRKFFFATLAGTLVSGAVGLYMAYSGYGVWALVGQYLTNAVIATIMLWIIMKWHPRLVFSFKRLKALFSYGWKLLVSGLLDTGYNELRGLVIGKKYAPSDLAYYEKGKQFPSLVAVNINASFNSVLFSAMSKVQDDRQKVKAATRKSIRLSSYLLMPCMMGLACVAEPFVRIILTDKWLPAVPYIQIMCFVYAFYPIHTANLTAIQAVGRSDLFLKLEIIKKAVGIVSLLISMWFGVIWIALTAMLTTLISSFINAFPNKKLLNYSYGEQIKDLLPAVGLSVLMGVPVYLMNFISLNIYALLCLQVFVGVGLYLGASIIFKVESFGFIWKIVKKMLKRKNAEEQSGRNNAELLSAEEIESFLRDVDKDFPIPLSEKTDLKEYALKLQERATLFVERAEGTIVSMVAGYTNDSQDGLAYIAVLATKKECRGRGLAEKLLQKFLSECKEKGFKAVHLYAVKENEKAVALYQKLGFEEYFPANEQRPNDLHLILKFES